MSGKNSPRSGGEGPCSEGDDCLPLHKITHPLRYYEFTEDEIKVLEECDKESFYRRCLPFSALFASFTYFAVKTGIFSRNPHFGAFPKILVAILLGQGVGRASYIRKCERKLRHDLPSSSHLHTIMVNHYENRKKLAAEKNKPPEPPK